MRFMVDVPSSVPADPAKIIQDMLIAQCVGLNVLPYYLQHGLAHETFDIPAHWEHLTHPVGPNILQVIVTLPATIPMNEQASVIRRIQAQLTTCQPFGQRRSEVTVTAHTATDGIREPV